MIRSDLNLIIEGWNLIIKGLYNVHMSFEFKGIHIISTWSPGSACWCSIYQCLLSSLIYLLHFDMQCAKVANSWLMWCMCWSHHVTEGLDTQGLYRISSAKSKMERLCQLFESGAERVDLSDLPPHLISSCLKLYFRQVSCCDNIRVHVVVAVLTCSCAACSCIVASGCGCFLCFPQLPEPLLTFGLYQEFLTFARVSLGNDSIYFWNCIMFFWQVLAKVEQKQIIL